MARRSYKDIFLDELSRQTKQGKNLIGNKQLRDILKWNDTRYSQIRQQLLSEKAILAGRGRGGTIGLASIPGSLGLSAFVSYAHEDEDLKNQLTRHLEPLRRLKKVETWHDGQILPGSKWKSEISTALEKADIILLLVSIDFINSNFCYEVELEKALERNAKRQAAVVPVILRECLWKHTSFAELQALPKDGRAVTSWADRDEALSKVADGILLVAERLLGEH